MDTSVLRVEPSQSYSAFTNEQAAAAPAGGDRTAVLVVHGMGQQRKFETLSSVVDGIERASGRVKKAVARNVRIGDERASRMELELADGRKVDVYEAYWASITEGQVTLRDVMSFLWSAAFNGFRNSRTKNPFKRWIFNQHQEPDVAATPGRKTRWYLVLAAAVLLSLVFMNSLTLILGTANALEAGPKWLKDPGLVEDLTASILMFLGSLAAFFVVYKSAAHQKGPGQRLTKPLLVSKLGLWMFLVVCGVAILSAITMLLSIGLQRHREFWDGPAHIVGAILLAVTVLLLAAAGAIALMNVRRSTHRASDVAAAVAAFAAIPALLIVAATRSVDFSESVFALMPSVYVQWLSPAIEWMAARWAVIWMGLAFVSAHARKFLVQYVGDVAAYVGGTSLDRFDTIRERIKDCTSRTANAIYRAEENGAFAYRNVAIVGHSLGSVAAYDCLNRMLNEDAHAKGALRVAERTTGLVTFGSPLDKTAFLFETNVATRTAARAALAATVQPMIAHPQTLSIPWTNIYSPWDIISGDLNFYGRAESVPPKNRVENLVDYDAVAPLGAHTEYWDNDLVWMKVNAILPRQEKTAAVSDAPPAPPLTPHLAIRPEA
ncbi:MAG TPA: hypothetical protein VF846_03910 [Thermoanaerobaculia bacterium]|jgi:hypothetical protein